MKDLKQLQKLFILFIMVFGIMSCNDDDEPQADITVSFANESYSLGEGNETLEVLVNLSAPAPEPLTIPVAFSGSAIEGTDYEAVSPKEVVIDVGESTGSLFIVSIDNNSVESETRGINLSLDLAEYPFLVAGAVTEATINVLDNDEAGAFLINFDETSFTTNEFLQDSLVLTLRLNQAFPEDLTLNLTTAGTANAENYQLAAQEVTFEANNLTAGVGVKVLDTKSYGETSELIVSFEEPDNAAITAGIDAAVTISIINPLANVRVFAPDADFARLYAYNTFADEAVPATGRGNDDPQMGTIFDESFAFTTYPFATDNTRDPNVFGFATPLWTEEDFTRSTNILNMVELYSGDWPNTVNMEISSGSAGLYAPEMLRLSPSSVDATSGTVSLIIDELRVYQPDAEDTGNPPSFVIGLSGEGTYDEVLGIINLTVTFDETAIDNGMQVRRYEFPIERRAR